jgi:hypothetical protein
MEKPLPERYEGKCPECHKAEVWDVDPPNVRLECGACGAKLQTDEQKYRRAAGLTE